LRDGLRSFWQSLLPLREWVQLVLMPFIYQWGIPTLLFGVGMINGYVIYKVNVRQQILRGADVLVSWGIRAVVGAPFLLVSAAQWLLTGSMESTSGAAGGSDAAVAWVESARAVIFFRTKLLPFTLNLFYAVFSLTAVAFYVVPLSLLAYPPAEFQMVSCFSQHGHCRPLWLFT
jgi:hypothetical protein